MIARRTFIGGTAAALAATPWAALAQPAARKARVAFLTTGDPNTGAMRYQVDPLRLGLRELGYVEGQNLAIELRWADGRMERLPALLAELMQLRPDVLITVGPRPTMLAKDATSSLPIVAVAIDDPVEMGLAVSYARPGRNITGVSGAFRGIFAKRFQLLKDIVPTARKIGVLYNPDTVKRSEIAESVARNEQALGVSIVMLEARGPDDIDAAFATMAKDRVDAVSILADPIFWLHRARLTELCQKQRLPSVWPNKGYLEEAGGLISYQGDFAEMFRRSGALVGKILNGTKPADIPFEQATKLALVVNLKVAKAIGLTIPRNVLLTADEVIE
jgi:putative ABC transport system substrate-binding protein